MQLYRKSPDIWNKRIILQINGVIFRFHCHFAILKMTMKTPEDFRTVWTEQNSLRTKRNVNVTERNALRCRNMRQDLYLCLRYVYIKTLYLNVNAIVGNNPHFPIEILYLEILWLYNLITMIWVITSRVFKKVLPGPQEKTEKTWLFVLSFLIGVCSGILVGIIFTVLYLKR